MVVDMVLAACGLVLLLAGFAVLTAVPPGELSARSIAAFIIGLAGALLVVRLAGPREPATWHDVLLPLGVAVWICRAAWLRRGQPMRRATDWGELDDRGSSRV